MKSSDDEVDVWLIHLDAKMHNFPEVEILSNEEMDRAKRFRSTVHRQRFITGRAAMRTILAHYLVKTPDCVIFDASPFGKPRIAGGNPLRFNLSHSGEIALLAVSSRRDVGIDVEELRPSTEMAAIATQFFSPAELKLFFETPVALRTRLFFRTWTRKEAYLKGLGIGLSGSLEDLNVGACATPLRLPGGWTLIDLDSTPGHVAALAAEGQDWGIRYFVF